MRNLVWNAYRDNGHNKIEVLNVFQHTRFADEIKELAIHSLTKEEFSFEARKTAKYFFAWKSEYEIILTSWPPYISAETVKKIQEEDLPNYRKSVELTIAEKVDIFQQIDLNWDIFVDYCWSFYRKED